MNKPKNTKMEYWLVDRDLFRAFGKVDKPLLISKTIEDARMKKSQHIKFQTSNAVIAQTCIEYKTGEIKYQQIVR
jgi:hypothetical protein